MPSFLFLKKTEEEKKKRKNKGEWQKEREQEENSNASFGHWENGKKCTWLKTPWGLVQILDAQKEGGVWNFEKQYSSTIISFAFEKTGQKLMVS